MKIFAHDNYDQGTFENDIALIKIKESFDLSSNVRSICYNDLSQQAAIGTAVGYGSTDQSKQSEHSNILRQVDIPIVSQEECFDSDPDYFGRHLFEGNFCAGEIDVMKGVCSGDSGGGFYVSKSGNWFLQGITSNTKLSDNPINPTCNFASFAVFTNVTFYQGK